MDSFYNDELVPATFWTVFDIDYDSNAEASVKSLLDLSSEKMITNISLLFDLVNRTPPFIYCFILQKALARNRVLSIRYLLRYYPKQSFVLPIPNDLKNWSVFFKKNNELQPIIKSFKNSVKTAVYAFFDIINFNLDAQLEILDLREASIEDKESIDFKDILLQLPKPNFSKGTSQTSSLNTFSNDLNTSFLVSRLNNICLLKNPPVKLRTLKTGLVVVKESDLKMIASAKTATFISSYFKLNINGLHLFNSIYSNKTILELLELLDADELEHFTIELCSNQFQNIFPNLKKFQCLHSLSLSYVDGFSTDSNFLTSFAETLNNLSNLRHLSLRGSQLSGCLRALIRHKCKEEYLHAENQISHNLDCCVLHRGKIEYLDISACRLWDEDLVCLWEFSVTKKLKYLNLGYNTLDVSRLCETFKIIGASLVVLDIERCSLSNAVQLLFVDFKFLSKIKSINMKALPAAVEDLEFLLTVVKNMATLRKITLSQPTNEILGFKENYQRLMKENGVEISWCFT